MYHVRTDRTGLKPEDIAAEGETGEAEVVRKPVVPDEQAESES